MKTPQFCAKSAARKKYMKQRSLNKVLLIIKSQQKIKFNLKTSHLFNQEQVKTPVNLGSQ